MPIEIIGKRRIADLSAEGQTILELLRQLQLDPARVAVELDRRDRETAALGRRRCSQAGAQIEIVQFVGGG